jgi:hypothetical protein
MGYGQDGHIGISFQESFGTSYTDSMDFFPFITENLNETVEELLSETLSSRYEEPDSYEGMHSIEGEIAVEVHPQMIGKFLLGVTGQESVSYSESCYSHLFVPATTEFTEEVCAVRPATIEVYRDTGSAYLYYDCVFNTLTIEIAQGAFVKATAGIVGAKFSWANKQTPSYEVGSYFTWDTTSISLAGAAITDASALTVTLNNNIGGQAYLDGTKYHSRMLRTDYRTIEIGGTMLLVGDDEVRNYRAQTKQRLIITATDPTTVMNDHHRLEIDIPQMMYTEFPANIGGAGLIDVGFSAKGKYDTTSSYAIQYTLTNTFAAYI